jgi:hypothetical protein
MPDTIASLAIWWRGRRLAELMARRSGWDGVDRLACSRKPRQAPETRSSALRRRAGTALSRSGMVLRR